jgi:hypothetical protein
MKEKVKDILEVIMFWMPFCCAILSSIAVWSAIYLLIAMALAQTQLFLIGPMPGDTTFWQITLKHLLYVTAVSAANGLAALISGEIEQFIFFEDFFEALFDKFNK